MTALRTSWSVGRSVCYSCKLSSGSFNRYGKYTVNLLRYICKARTYIRPNKMEESRFRDFEEIINLLSLFFFSRGRVIFCGITKVLGPNF